MGNLSACKNVLKLLRTCLCIVLFAFMVVATISLQVTHVEPHSHASKDHRENTYSTALIVIENGGSLSDSDLTHHHNSLINELPQPFIFALASKHQQVNVSGFKAYFSLYCEFTHHAKAALFSYLYQKSLP